MMRTWIRDWRRSHRARRPAPPRPSRRPSLESLDRRCLLDAGAGYVQTGLASSVAGLLSLTPIRANDGIAMFNAST